MKEQKEQFWQEGVDGKRLALHLLKQAWLMAAAAAAGAVLCAGVYLSVKTLNAGDAAYAAVSQYYITYDADEFGKVYDYYNAYTWEHDVITCDAVTEYALQYLPESVTKEKLKESVTAKLPGDYRFMTVTVTTEDPALSDQIQEAYKLTLPHFAESTKGLGTVSLTQWEPAKEVAVDYRTGGALLLGAALGLALALFILLVRYGLDDSFYVAEDVARHFPYPVLGQLPDGRETAFQRELWENCRRLLPAAGAFGVAGTEEAAVKKTVSALELLQEKEAADRSFTAFPESARIGALSAEDYEALRGMDGVLLALPYGGRDGRAAAHLAGQLEKQGCRIAGVVLAGGTDWFLKRYYGKKRFAGKRGSVGEEGALSHGPGRDSGSVREAEGTGAETGEDSL